MPVLAYPGPNLATGNGVTTVFAYSFKILAESDLQVKIDGVLKTLTTDYTVDGVGDSGGGDVTFVAAPANLAVVQIARQRAYVRGTDYQRNGAFDEETVDADLDSLEMQVQQVAADITRSFKAPLYVTDDQQLTDAQWAARALMFLGFDGAGAFGLFSTPTAGALVVSAFIETLIDDADAATARATLGFSDSGFTTGDVKLTLKTTADTGWVLMDDKTIGDASSGATGRANADTSALFALLWANTADAECAVSTGRGASAAADFAAHKTIALPKTLGRALAVYGAGSGLTSRALAKAIGDENMQQHTHTANVTDAGHIHREQTIGGAASLVGGGGGATTIAHTAISDGAAALNTESATTGITVANVNAGTGTAENMQPTVFLNVMIKL